MAGRPPSIIAASSAIRPTNTGQFSTGLPILDLAIPHRLPTFAHLNFLLHQYGKIRAALKII